MNLLCWVIGGATDPRTFSERLHPSVSVSPGWNSWW
jgi:hypothetical protein